MFQVTLCHLKAKIQVDISKSDNSNLESKHDVKGHGDTFGDVRYRIKFFYHITQW